jgi:hypothetical protein
VPAPTQISKVITSPLNRILNIVSNYVQYNYGGQAGTDLGIVYGGGRPFLASDPTMKFVVSSPTARYGVLYLATDAQVATYSNFHPVTCSIGSDGFWVCTTTFSSTFNTIYSCGAYMYLGQATWVQAGCTAVRFKLVTTTYV